MDQSQVEAAKARTVQAFGDMASGYDRSGPAFFSHFGRSLVDLAGIAPGSRVLDIATGRGAVLFPAAASVGDGGSVMGIDLTEEMVAATTTDLRRSAIANAEVRAMDAESLDLADESFDTVLCGFGVMFFPRLAVALAEFRRVLRPDGALCVSTFETPPMTVIHPVMSAYRNPGLRPLTQELSTPNELCATLDEAAFKNVTIQAETFEVVYSDEDAYWESSMSLLPGVWYRQQSPETQSRFKDDIYRHLNSVRRTDGIHESITALFATARK